ncbi:hypothetical protein [Lysinibacillus fusiformis]|uniref:hypothetical protein n=1 Tax=Lysinibacillus fusiformis TaxID=28031 RepID=UPI00088CEDC9|nr:hypothetical protein [Lysinibacillus fusiformis]SCX57257.1 hypothetical protein SAMN02787108_02527 [Lysinibacillus fusiformis]SDB34655.1 hypothetical protein SAMN02787070_02512 [Lysinibacillus fusiformis]SFI33062.1 hypothetical protein SAMN02787080_02294 [Lysinibacillus fusiformis]SFS91677.1 hypothetical protein SAMN02787099_02011 [Lysinibacillus fusiformis]
MIDYFERILRFKDMEIWDVEFGKDVYRLFIVDENRASEIKDLNLSPNAIFFEDDLRENLITVSVYSKHPVKKEHIEPIDRFSKQLTDHVALAHCQVVVTFYTGIVEKISKMILQEKYDLDFDKIPLQKLLHLNQD